MLQCAWDDGCDEPNLGIEKETKPFMRNAIRFLRRGQIVELPDVGPTDTLLDYLRLTEGACGTKEGCGEGDCGACTVAIGNSDGRGGVAYRPVNACIHLLGQIDGAEIVAIEDLAGADGTLHPIQQAMVDHHGSQCGFCTPGIVMALFAMSHADTSVPDRETVNDWLAGNLCRCTGYRPIVAAATESAEATRSDKFAAQANDTAAMLDFLSDKDDVFIGDENRFLAIPATVDSLAQLYYDHPDACLIAGATDVGLWITKQLRRLDKVIFLNRVDGLNRVEETEGSILIGATATYADTEGLVRAIDPDLGTLWRRIGSKQVRAAGTIGGNIANGSPIGDTPPVLIALGATLELRQGDVMRTLSLEDFFLDYGRQDRGKGEFVTGILVPKPGQNDIFRCHKISKRFDQDISSVLGAFKFTVIDGRITACRIAFGGMAAIPERAIHAESALIDVDLASPRDWSPALSALAKDYQPISDMRASAGYRLEAARVLLGKALAEAGGAPSTRTRVIGQREAADVA